MVTGAASGIGRCTADLLRERGDRVIGVDLRGTEVLADLSTGDGRRAAAEAVLARTGGTVDGVVTCAGLAGTDPRLVSVNYFGTTELLAHLRPALAAAPRPRAVAVSSVVVVHGCDEALVEACLSGAEAEALALAGRAVAEGRGRQLYPSSKAALARWVRRTCLAPGWADAGIPLNAVGPGVVLTPMAATAVTDERTRRARDAAVPMPLNHHQPPESVAEVLAFLVSEANSHITGQLVYADGGAEATLRGPLAY
ncbi:SDR family oxidoreductase [Saccharopolyspora cebuensis]|uniref:SDR family oxidoreductase n=1 Tax=Saccharopolyspora cebuensis TaxID=418759 RepID=A0ABV4CW27_9PSEU